MMNEKKQSEIRSEQLSALEDIERCIAGWEGEGFEETAKTARAKLAQYQRIEEALEIIMRQIAGWNEEYGLHNMNLAIESTKQDAAYAKGWNECRHEMARWLKEAASLNESEMLWLR